MKTLNYVCKNIWNYDIKKINGVNVRDYIKLNKTSAEFTPRIIHENIPKNSYIFYMTDSVLNKPILDKFNLKSFLT